MPKATTVAPARARTRQAGAAIDQIQAAMQVIAKSSTLARSHQRILQAAGVQLDRAGAALLYQLHLDADGAPRVTSLAARLGVDTPTVTRKVQQLERDGLVARHADADDRRAIRITLTPTGATGLERVLRAKREALERMLDGWAEGELLEFAALLTRFATATDIEMEAPRDC